MYFSGRTGRFNRSREKIVSISAGDRFSKSWMTFSSHSHPRIKGNSGLSEQNWPGTNFGARGRVSWRSLRGLDRERSGTQRTWPLAELAEGPKRTWRRRAWFSTDVLFSCKDYEPQHGTGQAWRWEAQLRGFIWTDECPDRRDGRRGTHLSKRDDWPRTDCWRGELSPPSWLHITAFRFRCPLFDSRIDRSRFLGSVVVHYRPGRLTRG